jgi:hypothetical protein
VQEPSNLEADNICAKRARLIVAVLLCHLVSYPV